MQLAADSSILRKRVRSMLSNRPRHVRCKQTVQAHAQHAEQASRHAASLATNLPLFTYTCTSVNQCLPTAAAFSCGCSAYITHNSRLYEQQLRLDRAPLHATPQVVTCTCRCCSRRAPQHPCCTASSWPSITPTSRAALVSTSQTPTSGTPADHLHSLPPSALPCHLLPPCRRPPSGWALPSRARLSRGAWRSWRRCCLACRSTWRQ
jgi:hypothetical protein